MELECFGGGTGLPGDRGVSTYFVVLHKVHEGGALYLHRLALPVVEGQHKVKEIGFPQVGRRLLLKMGPRQGDATVQEETQEQRTQGRRERYVSPTHPPT